MIYYELSMDSNNKIFALEVLLKHKSITETFASCLLVICNFPGFGNCGLYSFPLPVCFVFILNKRIEKKIYILSIIYIKPKKKKIRFQKNISINLYEE